MGYRKTALKIAKTMNVNQISIKKGIENIGKMGKRISTLKKVTKRNFLKRLISKTIFEETGVENMKKEKR